MPVAVLTVAAVAWAKRTATPRSASTATVRWAMPRPTRSLVFAMLALVAFMSIYAYVMIYHDDLVGIDYAQLTAQQFVEMPIWPHNGRFFPLAFQEYNLISLLGRSATHYHVFSILQLVVVLICVFHILDTLPHWLRCLVMLFIMTLPSFVNSFFGLIYPERDIIFWLCLWLVCLRSFYRTANPTAFYGALLTAQFMLYYKETAFLLVGGFAAGRLLVTAWQSPDGTGGWFTRFVKTHALESAHLSLCALFLAVYLLAIASRIETSYANPGVAGTTLAALRSRIESDLLFDALVIAFVWRLIAVLSTKRTFDPFWEPLAAGAITYALAYVALGLVKDYLMAPVHVVAAFYLARLAYDTLRSRSRMVVASVVVLLAWVVQGNLAEGAYYLLSRKEFVDGNVQLELFLKSYARSRDRANLALYFPQPGGFQLMEFSAFLRFKGFRSTDDSVTTASGETTFVVKSPHRYPDDRCHASQPFRCVHTRTAEPGDLVVFLPGRHVSARELQTLKSHANEIFHYRPRASAIKRALSALVPADRLTDRPTDAYVFEMGQTRSQ
jgi:hypothetical protein